ncbi:MAG: CopG family transcriptional regulator [Alphaproteobacteria bacterium]|jgi:predicted RNase H-like HicB family nuclease|nr:CopG family transcriptional regulator [Alphaproteobacteria bacterium]
MPSYIGLIRKEPGTIYGIDFPDFPGCISADETLEACLKSGREALQTCVQFMLDEGMEIPSPSSLEDILADPDSHDALAVLVELPPVKGKAVRVNITLDEYLLTEIDRAASRRQMNRSNFLAWAARQAMHRPEDQRRALHLATEDQQSP